MFEAVYSPKAGSSDFLKFYSPESEKIRSVFNVEFMNAEEKMAFQNICRALISCHVDPRRIIEEYAGCLSFATLVDDERGFKNATGVRTEAVKTAVELLARYVSSVRDNSQYGRSEASKAKFLIQTWQEYAASNMPYLQAEKVERITHLMTKYADSQLYGL
jgi:hypothetical protein